MKIAAARFGNRIDDDGTFRVFRAEVRGQHLELLDHVGVGIDRSRAVTARVRDMGAVRRNVDVAYASSIGNIGAVQRALAATVAVTVNTNHFARVV